MFKRRIIEFGINPILGCVALLLSFYAFSIILYSKTEYASYLYVLMATVIVLQFSENNRNDFLKFIYPKKVFATIRILENSIITLPFFLFLGIKTAFWEICLLITISIILSFWNKNHKIIFTIPTPFFKKPFEFIIGFRKSFIGFLFAYFLDVMAIINQNFNLGAFALFSIFLICLTFYTNTEKEFYVWIHNRKVNKFLFYKISIAIIFSTLLTLPITFSLLFYFQTNIVFIIALQTLGYCYLIAFILAKYAAFPNRISFPQIIILTLIFTMPLFCLVVIPFFYFQSKAKLKQILE